MGAEPDCPVALASAATSDHVPAQHARLIHYLQTCQQATRAELERACDVPSVTKRVCELIAEGWPIERKLGHEQSAHGLRRATFYRLTGPRRQRDLFEPEA